MSGRGILPEIRSGRNIPAGADFLQDNDTRLSFPQVLPAAEGAFKLRFIRLPGKESHAAARQDRHFGRWIRCRICRSFAIIGKSLAPTRRRHKHGGDPAAGRIARRRLRKRPRSRKSTARKRTIPFLIRPQAHSASVHEGGNPPPLHAADRNTIFVRKRVVFTDAESPFRTLFPHPAQPTIVLRRTTRHRTPAVRRIRRRPTAKPFCSPPEAAGRVSENAPDSGGIRSRRAPSPHRRCQTAIPAHRRPARRRNERQQMRRGLQPRIPADQREGGGLPFDQQPCKARRNERSGQHEQFEARRQPVRHEKPPGRQQQQQVERPFGRPHDAVSPENPDGAGHRATSAPQGRPHRRRSAAQSSVSRICTALSAAPFLI